MAGGGLSRPGRGVGMRSRTPQRRDPGILHHEQAAELLHRGVETLAQGMGALRQSRLRRAALALLGHQRRGGDDVRTAEGEKTHLEHAGSAARPAYPYIELYPGARCPASRRAAVAVGACQRAEPRRMLEVAASELVVRHVPAIWRRRSTARVTTVPAVSMSASLVKRPKLNRRLLSANRSSRPSARRTYEGSCVADVQADPVDTARCGCTAASKLSPSTPANDTLSTCGTRAARSPLRMTPPISRSLCHKRSPSAAMRSCSGIDMGLASSNAVPMPTAWCVATVPERSDPSWPPP